MSSEQTEYKYQKKYPLGRSVFLNMLIFGLIGPPVGGHIFMFLLSTPSNGNNSGLLLNLYFYMATYIFGLIPSLITAIFFAVISFKCKLSSPLLYLTTALIGALSSIVYFGIMMGSFEVLVFFTEFTIPVAFAGAGSTLVILLIKRLFNSTIKRVKIY